MSTTKSLLGHLKTRGVSVSLSKDNCNLKLHGPKEAVDVETLAPLKEHKAAIVQLLSNAVEAFPRPS